ncbi:MAG: transglutaminase-like domain-containing protein, partial [Bifidobacteriaceae bacterium]|nr:transglutaminase-like domain-containing protein [Bifidobacteriaceae bacterium]
MKTRPRVLTLPALGDLAAVLILLGCALAGFEPVYEGFGFAPAAAGGVALGLVVAFAAAWLRLGPLTVAAATVLVFALGGGPLGLRGLEGVGLIPSARSLKLLFSGAVGVWRDFITATTPVSPFPELALAPFIVGLVGAVLAASMAWRWRRPAWALVPVAAAAAAVVALGVSEPAWPRWQAALAVVAALIWLSWRSRTAEAESGLAAGSGPAAGTGRGGRSGRAGRSERGGRADRAAGLAAGRAAGAGDGWTSGGPGAGGEPAAVRLARWRGIVIVVAAAVAVVALAGPPATGGLTREVLREHVIPPLDLRNYASPLASFRQYVGVKKDVELFEVTGLPSGARLRLAVMDAYDGLVYDVASLAGTDTGLYQRVGPGIGAGRGAGEGAEEGAGEGGGGAAGRPAESAQVEVAVGGYQGVWVPTAGQVGELRFAGGRSQELQEELYFNPSTGGAIDPLGLAEGDRYTISALIEDPVELNDLANYNLAPASLAPVTNVPEVVAAAGSKLAGDSADPAERIVALAGALKDPTRAFFSHGVDGAAPSAPGHGAARIQAFLNAAQMVGDDEQYAVAMALMSRQLGLPARVVMGFAPAEDSQVEGDTWTVTGKDVHAWVEFKFETLGWVAVDPSPPENQVLTEQQPKANEKPNPQVLQPPPPPQEPAELPP